MNIISYILKILVPKVKAFEEATKDPMESQRNALLEYLTRNEKTLYGQEHKFCDITTIDEYQKKVPLNDYESIEPYINRMKNGEKNVLTIDKPILFGVTSGTTGRQKFIPVTSYSRIKKK